MKKLRVYLVEKEVNKAETLANRLNEKKDDVLKDYEIEFIGGRFDYQHLFSPVAITHSKPDMLILDYATANLTLDSLSEKPIAEQIRANYPFLPIILMHRGDLKEKYRISTTELSNRKLGNTKVFDGFIDPCMSVSDMQETIKKNLRKPLNMMIVGLGILGRQFLRIFARANEIEKIKGYSENVPYDVILKSIDHLGARKDKVTLVKSLEEGLGDIECVLICTSSIRALSLLERLAKKDDRLDLLPEEGAKIFSYFKKIAQGGYQGLVTPFTNPVGGCLALAKKAGIKHEQLTSPINIDNARFEDAVREYMGREYSFFINAFLEGKVVGDHGVPSFVELRKEFNRKENIKINYEETLETVRKIINDSLVKARQMPRDALQNTAQLEESGYEAAPESAVFYKRLAHFEKTPNESAYCYYKINGISGFTALPVRVDYFPYIRIYPNEDYLKLFDEKTIENLKKQLILQNICVKQFLSKRILVGVK